MKIKILNVQKEFLCNGAISGLDKVWKGIVSIHTLIFNILTAFYRSYLSIGSRPGPD